MMGIMIAHCLQHTLMLDCTHGPATELCQRYLTPSEPHVLQCNRQSWWEAEGLTRSFDKAWLEKMDSDTHIKILKKEPGSAYTMQRSAHRVVLKS
jgi:hypothetical protein